MFHGLDLTGQAVDCVRLNHETEIDAAIGLAPYLNIARLAEPYRAGGRSDHE
jgi:hypothetical protein